MHRIVLIITVNVDSGLTLLVNFFVGTSFFLYWDVVRFQLMVIRLLEIIELACGLDSGEDAHRETVIKVGVIKRCGEILGIRSLKENSFKKLTDSLTCSDQPVGQFGLVNVHNNVSSQQQYTESFQEIVRLRLTVEDSVELCKEGVGGTYFIRDEQNDFIAVFKPCDEEPGALLNPKNIIKKPLMPPGGGAIREVAAYLLDKNRAGVPETVFLRNVIHRQLNNGDRMIPKTGSLQRFVPNIGNAGCMGSSIFSVGDVHNIGLLDIRLLNLDRNAENMLITKNGNDFRLVPIDHTYSLPETFGYIYYEWHHWRQAKIPFSQQTLQWISNLNPEADAKILRELGIPEAAITLMKLSTILLKAAASCGFTLFQIASLITRRRMTEPCQFEKFIALAKHQYSLGVLEQLALEFIHSLKQ